MLIRIIQICFIECIRAYTHLWFIIKIINVCRLSYTIKYNTNVSLLFVWMYVLCGEWSWNARIAMVCAINRKRAFCFYHGHQPTHHLVSVGWIKYMCVWYTAFQCEFTCFSQSLQTSELESVYTMKSDEGMFCVFDECFHIDHHTRIFESRSFK